MARPVYVKTAANTWEQVATNIQAIPNGLVPIVPTSVTGTGVSVTADGTVSFSGSTAININGVFSAAYRDYRVVLTGTSTGNNASFNLQFRAAGVNATTAAYQSSGSIAYAGAALSSYGGSGGTSALVAYASAAGGANGRTSGSWDITNPAEAVPTQWRGMTNGFDSNYFTLTQGGIHTVATAYDGFTINIGSGAGTGTIQVYGYSKGAVTQPSVVVPYSMSAGVTGSIAAGGSAVVTFPVGRFTQTPIITATSAAASSVNPGNPNITGATSTSFTIYNTSSATRAFYWQAVQMTSASGNG